MTIRKLARAVGSKLRSLIKGRQVEIREDDVFLVSYPRSGNTWVRFLLANVIDHETEQAIDFHSVHSLIPDYGMREHHEYMKTLATPRIMKSHSTFDPRFQRVIYLVRDGRDVMVSYYDYETKHRRFSGSFQDFLLSSRLPYGFWADHVQSWLNAREERDLLVVRYEDLLQGTELELDRMTRFAGLKCAPDVLERAVRLSAFDQMQKLEETRGRPYGDTSYRFVRRGTAGQWHSKFDEESKAIFKSQANSLLLELGYVDSPDW